MRYAPLEIATYDADLMISIGSSSTDFGDISLNINTKFLNLTGLLSLCLVLASPVMAQDISAGKKTFKKCSACHQVGEGAKNRVGPPLNGVVGREAASLEGFKYSKVMKESGLTWTVENLTGYLTKPKKFLKGNKMSFAGIKKPEDIANVIAFLENFNADGTKITE